MKIFWTDGSAVPNPGQGGFAVIDAATKNPIALGRGAKTTNIRMEGQAILAALNLAKNEPCEIHTDSAFWINVLTKWAPGWEKYDWKKGPKHNEKIENLELVQALFTAYRNSQAKLIWEKGHAGTELNELADLWANHARTGQTFADLEIREAE